MIDSHSHLYLEEFDNDRDAAVSRAKSAGLKRLILPNVDSDTIVRMEDMHSKYPSFTEMAMGLHPTSVTDDWKHILADMEKMFHEGGKFVAVGEVGIDLYWDATFKEQQIAAFDRQLHWAETFNLPVIIHCRNGLDEILSVFAGYEGSLPQCVFHSFGGNAADIDRIRRYGDFYFGINGIVTFKNSDLRSVLPVIGLERILLETDCPYLTPVPYRGRRNESSYIPYIAGKIAEEFKISTEEVSKATDHNASSFFNIEL